MRYDFKRGYQDGQIHYLVEFAINDIKKSLGNSEDSISEDTISHVMKLVKSQIKNFTSMNVVIFNHQGKKIFGDSKFKKIESIINIINNSHRFSTEDLFDDVDINDEVYITLYKIVDDYDSNMITDLYCLSMHPYKSKNLVSYNFYFFTDDQYDDLLYYEYKENGKDINEAKSRQTMNKKLKDFKSYMLRRGAEEVSDLYSHKKY